MANNKTEIMVFNDETGRYEAKKKVPLKQRIKGKLNSISENQKAERQFKQGVKKEAKSAERDEYRRGYIEGKRKTAYQKGRKAGSSGFGGGLFSSLEGVAKGVSKHIEIGPEKGSGGKEYALGFDSQISGADLGLGGFGALTGSSRKKSRKSDPYADLGL